MVAPSSAVICDRSSTTHRADPAVAIDQVPVSVLSKIQTPLDPLVWRVARRRRLGRPATSGRVGAHRQKKTIEDDRRRRIRAEHNCRRSLSSDRVQLLTHVPAACDRFLLFVPLATSGGRRLNDPLHRRRRSRLRARIARFFRRPRVLDTRRS
uniref:Uncharacterized protein n=1 Tax=Plectus sambesii TaxID=2011161 RepID=A0A914VJ81_9BILA